MYVIKLLIMKLLSAPSFYPPTSACEITSDIKSLSLIQTIFTPYSLQETAPS